MFKYGAFIAVVAGAIFYFFGVTSQKFNASYPYPVPVVFDAFGRDFVPKDLLIAEGNPNDVTVILESEKNRSRTYIVQAEGDEIARLDLQFVPVGDGSRSQVAGSIKPAMVQAGSVRLKDPRQIATALDIRLGTYNRMAMKAQAMGYASIDAMMMGMSPGAQLAFGKEGARDWGNEVSGMMRDMADREAEEERAEWAGKNAYGSDLAVKALRDRKPQ